MYIYSKEFSLENVCRYILRLNIFNCTFYTEVFLISFCLNLNTEFVSLTHSVRAT